MNYVGASPETASHIKTWTRCDHNLSRVYKWIQLGWPDKCLAEGFRPYFACNSKLSTGNGCIMWGSRVVLPESGHKQVLEELHESHIGRSRMKSLARSYVWWPRMDQVIETLLRHVLRASCTRINLLQPWEWPSIPWSRLHIDHVGPFMEKLFLIVTDAQSKWLEVVQVSSTASSVTITASKPS